MDRNDLNRLTHTMMSFAAMVVVQRALRLLFLRYAPGIGPIGDFLIFLFSFGTAFALFRIPVRTEEETDPVPPLEKKRNRRCFLHLVASTAGLVTLMFLVAAIMNGDEAFSGSVSAAGGMPSLDPLSVVCLLAVHPLAEEFLFRRLYYGELRRMDPVFGCMAQAVMFAILHRSVDEMLYALAAGVILGILAEETGRLWPCAAAHIFVNARSLVAVTVLAERGGVRYAMDSTLLTVGAAAFVVLAATRARFAADPESSADPSRKTADAGKQEARA